MNKIKMILLFIALSVNLLSCDSPVGPSATAPASTAKTITSFIFAKDDNASLHDDYPAVVDEASSVIRCTLPASASINGLVPRIELSPKASISPVSGEALDFSTEREFIVHAEDGSLHSYTTDVRIATASDSTTADLSSLSLLQGNDRIERLQSFNSSEYEYDIVGTNSASYVVLKPVAVYAGAEIKIKLNSGPSIDAHSGSETARLNLSFGENILAVIVQSFDKLTEKEYLININRGGEIVLDVSSNQWRQDSLGYDDTLEKGQGAWYKFSTTPGSYYQIAVDDKATSIGAWTTSNGGFSSAEGTGPTATGIIHIVKKDGTSYYTPIENPSSFKINSVTQSGCYYTDSQHRYLTVLAEEDSIRFRVSQVWGSMGTIAVQVRERLSLPAPIALSPGEWHTADFSDDPWVSQDRPVFIIDTVPGQEYVVGVDDDSSVVQNQGSGCWTPSNGGSVQQPTAKNLEFRVLTQDEAEYAYIEGGSGWVVADDYNSKTFTEKRAWSFVAIDNKALIQVKGPSAQTQTGSFAVQARPLIAKDVHLSPSREWTTSETHFSDTVWGAYHSYEVSTIPGAWYHIGIDDREYSHVDVNWTTANGGNALVRDSCMKYRVFQFDKQPAIYTPLWIEPRSDAWIEADESMVGPPDYRQRRMIVVRATGNSIRIDVKDNIRYVNGVYAIQVREQAVLTPLTLEDDWLLRTIGDPDIWEMDDTAVFSLSTAPGTTYYVMVDDFSDSATGEGWTPSTGGYTVAPSAEVTLRIQKTDGNHLSINRSNGSSTEVVGCDGRDSLYFWFVAEEESTLVYVSLSSSSNASGGTFAIKASASEPQL